MKTVKLVTLILSGFLFVQLQAQDANGNVEQKEEKKVIIIKKTIDENGKETTEKIVKEGDDAENIFFIDDNGEKVEIEIDKMLEEDGKTMKWTSKDGKDMKVIKKSETIEVDDDGEHKSIRIMMTGDGEADVYKWDGEGDIPEEIKKELQEKGIELEEMEDYIKVKKTSKSKMGHSNQAFLGVMVGKKEEIENNDGVETSTTDDSATVIDIVPNSAAEEAGLQKDDVITAINDTAINNFEDVVNTLGNFAAGDKITIAYNRNGQAATTNATLKGAADFEEVMMEDVENTNVEVSIEEDENGNMIKTTTTTITKNGKEKEVTKKVEKISKKQKKGKM